MKKQISIIIPFHKNKNMLKLSLKTLEKSISIPVEIIIIANNALEDEINLNLDPDKYTVHKITENLFWPGAVNLGVSIASGKYIVICDPDLFYWDNWLEPLINCFTLHKNIGVVSSKLINPLTDRIMDFGMSYNQFNVIHTTKGLLYNHPITMQDRKVQAACGAVFFTTKEIFNTVGGIDTDMPYIYCDNDFSIKLSKCGLDTWVAAKSCVYHKGDTDQSNSKYYAFSYLREDSKAAFYGKNSTNRIIDFEDWLSYFWNWYLNNTNNKQNNYILMDFTTLLDRNLYYECFKNELELNILDIYNYVIKERNISSLQLYNYIPTAMIDAQIPFIYFVDNFISLFDNKIWFKLRRCERDLVIDRHGNIINMLDIMNHVV